MAGSAEPDRSSGPAHHEQHRASITHESARGPDRHRHRIALAERDPLEELTRSRHDRIGGKLGDDLPVAWRHRSERYAEKLATPDTSVADLIGDGGEARQVDIAARLGVSVSAIYRILFTLSEMGHLRKIDRNTYGLFGLEPGVPTDAYSLDEAVADGHLVPPRGIAVGTTFLREGIRYDELSEEQKVVVSRARRIEQFLSQNTYTAKQFTGVEGSTVPVKDTVEGFKAIADGDLDHVAEQAFYNVGGLDDVEREWAKIQAEG